MAADYRTRLSDFMTEHVFGAEADYDDYRRAAGPLTTPRRRSSRN